VSNRAGVTTGPRPPLEERFLTMKLDTSVNRIIEALVIAALLWLGGQVRDLVRAIDNNTDSINQIHDWISDQETEKND